MFTRAVPVSRIGWNARLHTPMQYADDWEGDEDEFESTSWGGLWQLDDE